jgi:hypothetical protein
VAVLDDAGILRADLPTNSIQTSAWSRLMPPVPDVATAIRLVAAASGRRVTSVPRLVRAPFGVGYNGDWWMEVEVPAPIRFRNSTTVSTIVQFGWGRGGPGGSGLRGAVRSMGAAGTDTILAPDGSVSFVMRRRNPYDAQVVEVQP